MNFGEKICIVLLVSCIFISTNSVTVTYNLYFYKKEDCRYRTLNVLYSHLCLCGTIISFLLYAMVLHHLDFVHLNCKIFQAILLFQFTSKTHGWLFVGIATALSHFSPSMYSFLSYKLNYFSLLFINQILRYPIIFNPTIIIK